MIGFYLILILLFLGSEFFIAPFVFQQIRSRFDRPDSNHENGDDSSAPPKNNSAAFKGRFERGIILLGLIAGFTHILTLFGALKIATRIKDDSDKLSNDYFLIGNLASVGLAIATALISQWLFVAFSDVPATALWKL